MDPEDGELDLLFDNRRPQGRRSRSRSRSRSPQRRAARVSPPRRVNSDAEALLAEQSLAADEQGGPSIFAAGDNVRPAGVFVASPYGPGPVPPENACADSKFCFLCEIGCIAPTAATKALLARLRLLIATYMRFGMAIVCQEVRSFYEQKLLPLVVDDHLRQFWSQKSIGDHVFGHAASHLARLYFSVVFLTELRNQTAEQLFWVKEGGASATPQKSIDYRTCGMILRTDAQLATRLRELETAQLEEISAAEAACAKAQDESRSTYNSVRDLEQMVAARDHNLTNRKRYTDGYKG